MLKRWAEAVSRHPWWAIVVFVGITVLAARQIPQVQIDADIKTQLSPHMPARMNTERIEALFGGTDMVMVVLTADDVLAPGTLKRVEQLSRKMERIPLIDRVLSPFTLKDIRGEAGEMTVEPAIARIPRSSDAREALRATIRDNDLVYGNVVSEDFKAVAIVGLVKEKARDQDVLDRVKEVIADTPGPEPVHLAGMPYIRNNISRDIRHDMQWFMPLGLAVMLVFLLICFKRLRGVVLPFLVVVMSIALSIGLIPVFGWKIQIMTVILPVLLIAVANDYGIHLMARYQEMNRPDGTDTPREITRHIVERLGKPIIATAVTTMAGLLSLLSHVIVPAKQLGVLAAIGVAFALFGSLTFVPGVLVLLPKEKPVAGIHGETARSPLLERMLRATAGLVTRRPVAILVVSLIAVAAIATGIARVVVDTNPANYYPADAPIPRASDLVNRYFGGSTTISIVADGDIKSPEVLRQIEGLEKYLETIPEVGSVTSIVDVIRRMNRVMHDDDPNAEVIPETREAVAQYLLLYSMSGDPEDFDRLVDFPYEHALITARINTLSSSKIASVVSATQAYVKEHPEGPFRVIGGWAVLFSDLIDAVVRGQLISLFLSLILVMILVMILFRSFVAGFLAALPIGLAMIILFGLMGYFGIELNLVTTLLSSIMIGVGVDYTIHYLWRYREERRAGRAPVDAVRETLTTTGRGIIFNALSVIVGFSVLMISAFLPVRFFGFLVVVTIGSCLIGALLLLPAICLRFRPRFLEGKTANGERMMKATQLVVILGGLGLLLTATISSAQAATETLDAATIVRRQDQARRLDGAESIATLKIFNERGQVRVRKFASVSKLTDGGKTEKRLIRFLEPADVKGTGLLTYDYDQKDDDLWFFMPALRKTRRIVASEKAKSFMGSEFAYSDITPPPIEDFTYTLLGTETVRGELCWIIESVPKSEDIAEENGYSKRIAYIGQSDFMPRRVVYSDLDGSPWKELNVLELREIDPKKHRYSPTHMVMENKQNGRRSELTIEKIQLRPDVPDEYFTTRYLERP